MEENKQVVHISANYLGSVKESDRELGRELGSEPVRGKITCHSSLASSLGFFPHRKNIAAGLWRVGTRLLFSWGESQWPPSMLGQTLHAHSLHMGPDRQPQVSWEGAPYSDTAPWSPPTPLSQHRHYPSGQIINRANVGLPEEDKKRKWITPIAMETTDQNRARAQRMHFKRKCFSSVFFFRCSIK